MRAPQMRSRQAQKGGTGTRPRSHEEPASQTREFEAQVTVAGRHHVACFCYGIDIPTGADDLRSARRGGGGRRDGDFPRDHTPPRMHPFPAPSLSSGMNIFHHFRQHSRESLHFSGSGCG